MFSITHAHAYFCGTCNDFSSNLAYETFWSTLIFSVFLLVDIHRINDQLFVLHVLTTLMLQMHRYISKQAKFILRCWTMETDSDDLRSCFEPFLQLFQYSVSWIASLEDTHYCGRKSHVKKKKKMKVDKSYQISAKHFYLFLQNRFSAM